MYATAEGLRDQSDNFILEFDVFHMFIRTPTCLSELWVGELIRIYSLSHSHATKKRSFVHFYGRYTGEVGRYDFNQLWSLYENYSNIVDDRSTFICHDFVCPRYRFCKNAAMPRRCRNYSQRHSHSQKINIGFSRDVIMLANLLAINIKCL